MWSTAAFVIAAAVEPAQSTHVSGVHEHGPMCGESLAARVTRNLPEGVETPDDVEIDATLGRRDDGQWSLELEIARGDTIEPRTLVADDCNTVLDAAAFVIAVAVAAKHDEATPPTEPDRTRDPIPAAPVESTEPLTALPIEPSRDSRPASVTPPTITRRSELGAYLGVAGGVDVGALPRATGWFAGHAGVRGRWWRAGLQGGGRLPTEAFADLDPEAGGRFSLWTLGAHGCGVPTRGVIEVPLCASIEAGVLRTRGLGFDGARTLRRPWVAAALGPSLLWRVHPRVAVGLGVEVGLPLVRTAAEIENLEVLHTVGPVYARALLRLEMRLPQRRP